MNAGQFSRAVGNNFGRLAGRLLASIHQTPSSGCWKWDSCRKFHTARITRPTVATGQQCRLQAVE